MTRWLAARRERRALEAATRQMLYVRRVSSPAWIDPMALILYLRRGKIR